MKTPLFVVLFVCLLSACKRDKDSPQLTLADSVQLTGRRTDYYSGGSKIGIPDTSTFVYDKSGRLSEKVDVMLLGTSGYIEHCRFSRDNEGKITEIDLSDEPLFAGASQPPPNARMFNFQYASGAEVPSYYYTKYNNFDAPPTDSTALTYSNGLLSDAKEYNLFDASSHPVYSEMSWTFNNVGQLQTSIREAQDPQNENVVTYVFDDKINPLKMGAEAIIVDNPVRMSNGNPLSEIVQFTSGAPGNVESFTYTYRIDGRPLKSVVRFQSGPPDSAITVFYYSK